MEARCFRGASAVLTFHTMLPRKFNVIPCRFHGGVCVSMVLPWDSHGLSCRFRGGVCASTMRSWWCMHFQGASMGFAWYFHGTLVVLSCCH